MKFHLKKIRKVLLGRSAGIVLILVILLLGLAWLYLAVIQPYLRTLADKQDSQKAQEIEQQYQSAKAEAVSSKTVAPCEALPTESYRFSRSTEGVIHYNAKGSPDFVISLPRSQCTVAYAVASLDESVCASLPAKNHCYLEVGNALKLAKDDRYRQICAKISQLAVQKSCLDVSQTIDQTEYFATLQWGP